MLRNAFIYSALLWIEQTAVSVPSSSSAPSSSSGSPHISQQATAVGGEEDAVAELRGSFTSAPTLQRHRSPLEELLFPNRSKTYDDAGQLVAYDPHGRKLRYDAHGRLLSFPGTGPYPPDKYSTAVPCEICAGLKTCKVLNGLLIQEFYYPQFPGTLGTCLILDQRGERFALEMFGPDKTFRDSPTCRDLVMQVPNTSF